MPLNTGRARALGVEVAVGARLFERLELNASYTWTDAHYLGSTDTGAALQIDADRRMAHVPEHAAALQAQLALGAAKLWSDLRYESEIVFQVGSLTPQPAAFQVDAGIALKPHELASFAFFPAGLTLTVEGDNLTSVQRYDSLGLPLPKRPLWIVRVRAVRP